MGEQPAAWVREWEKGVEFIDHYRGIRWCDAPLPKEAHRCLAQTRAVVRIQGLPPMRIARCACGAVDIGNGWEDRNCRTVQSRRTGCETEQAV